MTCPICNSPLILFGSKLKCPSCKKMKIDNSDLLMAIDILRYLLDINHKQEAALHLLQTGHTLSINGINITDPAQLVLKRAVYKVVLKKHNSVVLKQRVFFQKERENASQNQGRTDIRRSNLCY